MKSLRVIVLILCASTLAAAGDPEFRGIVGAIENQYGVHHMHIPLLGVAMFFARPEGVSGLKLAIFENFHNPTAADEIRAVVENKLGPDWHPFVRVREKKPDKGDSGETTLIYVSPAGGKLRMMIVNVESSEATVVELKLSERAIKQWLDEPGEKARDHSGHSHHFDD